MNSEDLGFMPAMENRFSLLLKWMWDIAINERSSLLIMGKPNQHMNVEVGLERMERAGDPATATPSDAADPAAA